jgi:hypothetical protein
MRSNLPCALVLRAHDLLEMVISGATIALGQLCGYERDVGSSNQETDCSVCAVRSTGYREDVSGSDHPIEIRSDFQIGSELAAFCESFDVPLERYSKSASLIMEGWNR